MLCCTVLCGIVLYCSLGENSEHLGTFLFSSGIIYVASRAALFCAMMRCAVSAREGCFSKSS